jgi:hypothetical protein
VTFAQKLLVLTGIAAAVACAIAARKTSLAAAAAAGPDRPIVLSLAVVAGALLVVSQTVLRHIVQVAPLFLGALVAMLRPTLAASAAAPLFAFWLLVMAAIWLFLLDLARVFTGTFSPAEIALTLIIGTSCTLGLLASARRRTPVSMAAQVATVAGFAVLQCGAMWLSVQPFVAGR